MMATCMIFKLLSWSSLITVFMTDLNYGQSHLVMDTFSRQKETILLKEILQLVKNQAKKMQTLEKELTSINDKLSKCLCISRSFPSGRHDEEQQDTTTSLVSREQSTIFETNPTIQLTSAFDIPVVETEGETETTQNSLSTTDTATSADIFISRSVSSGRDDEEQQDTTTSLFSREQSTILETNPTIQLTSAFDIPVVETEGETETTQDSLSTTDTAKSAGGDREFLSTSTSLASTTAVIPSTTQAARSMGSRGREFLILFMKNHPGVHGNLSVYITTTNETRVKILTSPHFNAEITSIINFTSGFKLSLPLNLVGEYSTVEPKGLILQTSELSTVTIFDSFHHHSNDGTLVIPTEKLSNKYIVSSTDPGNKWNSQFAIGALYKRTNVEITFKFKQNTPLTIQGKTYGDGDVFKIMLQRFDTIQIGHTTNFSGTFIISTKPIAVFSGNQCQYLKAGCSHMVTQLPPPTEFDTQCIVPPFYNNNGTLIQVLSENRSSISSSVGNSVSNFHLNEKGYKNIEVTSNVITVIDSDQPVLVTAVGMGMPYHPYMTVLPGIHQYLDYYKIIVPGGYEENFICVVVPSQSLTNLRINGFSASHFTSVYQSEMTLTKQFSIRTFKVQSGTFVLSTTDASQFGLIVYGHREADGYGFAGNFVLP